MTMFELTPLIGECCLSSILLDQTCQRLLPAVEVASMGECDNAVVLISSGQILVIF